MSIKNITNKYLNEGKLHHSDIIDFINENMDIIHYERLDKELKDLYFKMIIGYFKRKHKVKLTDKGDHFIMNNDNKKKIEKGWFDDILKAVEYYLNH